MTDPIVYDWPLSIVPSEQLFHAPGMVFEGGFTVGGAETISPEPGGRALLEMAFNTLPSDRDSRIASWLFSKLASGAVFRIPLFRCVQLVAADDLPIVPPEFSEVGVPWQDDAGDDLLWDGEIGWGYDSSAQVSGTALEGETTFVLNMASYGRVLLPGHVIGYDSRAYVVDAIDYDDEDQATVTVTPPLRTNVELAEPVTFLPTMLGRAADPASFRAMFKLGKWVQPGTLVFSEVLL